jgi:hypothetical protein
MLRYVRFRFFLPFCLSFVCLAELSACCGGPPSGRSVTLCDGTLKGRIRFAEHLCGKLAAGSKEITLRSGHRRHIRTGQRVILYCMQSGRSFMARMTEVRHTSWQMVSDQELKDDGFKSRESLLPIMRRYYPNIAATDSATVYRFTGVSSCSFAEAHRCSW